MKCQRTLFEAGWLVPAWEPDLGGHSVGEEAELWIKLRFARMAAPKLPNVQTWRCREERGLRYVLDHLGELVVKLVDSSGGFGMLVGPCSRFSFVGEATGFHAEDGRFAFPVPQPALTLTRASLGVPESGCGGWITPATPSTRSSTRRSNTP